MTSQVAPAASLGALLGGGGAEPAAARLGWQRPPEGAGTCPRAPRRGAGPGPAFGWESQSCVYIGPATRGSGGRFSSVLKGVFASLSPTSAGQVWEARVNSLGLRIQLKGTPHLPEIAGAALVRGQKHTVLHLVPVSLKTRTCALPGHTAWRPAGAEESAAAPHQGLPDVPTAPGQRQAGTSSVRQALLPRIPRAAGLLGSGTGVRRAFKHGSGTRANCTLQAPKRCTGLVCVTLQGAQLTWPLPCWPDWTFQEPCGVSLVSATRRVSRHQQRAPPRRGAEAPPLPATRGSARSTDPLPVVRVLTSAHGTRDQAALQNLGSSHQESLCSEHLASPQVRQCLPHGICSEAGHGVPVQIWAIAKATATPAQQAQAWITADGLTTILAPGVQSISISRALGIKSVSQP